MSVGGSGVAAGWTPLCWAAVCSRTCTRHSARRALLVRGGTTEYRVDLRKHLYRVSVPARAAD